MNVIYNSSGAPQREAADDDKSAGREFVIKGMSIGHNHAEVYINFGQTVIIMPPATGKKLLKDLRRTLTEWEEQHGRLPEGKGKKRRESVPKRVLKELYKSRKIGSKLISINTSKRKHLPMKDD